MNNKFWHIIIYKDYDALGNFGWNASIAPTDDPSAIIDLFPFNYRTAKEVRIEVDKMFPVISWTSAKKAYVARDEECITCEV